MQTIFHKFIEVAASKPPQAALFIEFAYMEQQIRKSYKQLKDSKGVPKPNDDFVDYWKQIGGGNREQQVAVYFRWIELLQKSMTTSVHRELQDKQSQLYVKKSMMSKWDIRKVKLNGLDLQIFSKKLKIFPLKCFCIRKSKNKDHFSWVMQVVMQVDESKFKSFHIGTNNITEFQQWYKEVEMRIDMARIEYFRESIGSQAKIKVQPSIKNQEKPKIQKVEEIKKEQPTKKQLTNSQEIRLRNKTLTELCIDNQLKHIQQANQVLSIIEEKEPQQIHQEETHPNIFIRLFPDREIKNFCQNPTNAVLLECQKQYRLYDLNGTLKIFITMNSSIQIVFRAISESHSDWNPQINNFSIKNKISSQNSALIYQKYKSKGFLYKQRDYFFLRHCFTVESQNQKQKIFMIQKSIDSIHHPPFMTVTRGEKELIWCLVGEKDSKQCLLIVEGLVKGGGYMNTSEDKQVTIKKFKMLLQLDNYLKQIQYTKSSKDTNLFKERWLVSFKAEQQQEFYSPRQIQSDEFQNNKLEQMKQQKKNSIDQVSQNNQTVPKKIKQSQFQQFIKQTSQQHKQKVEQNKQKLYAPSVQNFSQQYKPPEFNSDLSVIIPQKFLKKKHQLEPRPKGNELYAQKVRGHHLWKGQWAVSEAGGLAYVDQQKMKAQKKVLTFIIKRIGKNILSGKGVLNISLPVDIFCRQSNIERLAMSFGYCPLYLQKVIDSNPLDQLKAVIASVMGSSLIYMTMQKPFNPILGQTYQCWIDGCPVYFEQIAHHPPIAAYLMKGRGYDLYGSVQAKMDLSINSGTGINQGIFTVHFHNGRKFHFTTPPGQLVGLTYGDRKLYFVDKTYFWSVEQGIFLEIVYNPMAKQSRFFGSGRTFVGDQKLQDYFEGVVRKYRPEDLKEFLTPKKNDSRKNMAIPRSLPPQQPISTHSKVYGRWTKHIYFGDQKIFDTDSNIYLKAYDQKNPLPSHSNYREDVVYRRLNEYVQSQQWKQILQVKQRKDRKLREQYQKKKGK